MTTIGRLHTRSLVMTAILGVLGVFGGSPLLGVAGGAALGALLASARNLHDSPRSKLRRSLVHAVTGVVLVLSMVGARTLGVDAVFVVLLAGLSNRMLLRSGHRDDLLIAGTSSVLLAAATVVTSGLGFLVLLLLFVPSLVLALWSSMMLGGAEHDPGQLRQLASRRAPKGAAKLAATGLSLTLLGFGLVALLPRYRFAGFLSAGAFGALASPVGPMSLGVDGVSARDTGNVVLRIEPTDGASHGDLEGLYARLSALDRFDGRTFTARDGGHYYPSPLRSAPNQRKGRIMVDRATVHKGHHPAVIVGRSRAWAVLDSAVHFEVGGSAVVDRSSNRTVAYDVALGIPLVWPELPPNQAQSAVSRERELPEGLDTRIRALAEALTRGRTTDEEKVQAVLGHFSRGFRYSLEPLEGTSTDPLVRFLFEAHAGHCELYAAAVTVLLRAAGVRARVATGYYLGRWNSVGGYLSFSDRDAHAWVEAWIEGQGWRWFDATPEDLRSRRAVSVWSNLQDLYEAASALWFDQVVDFDNSRQRRLFTFLRESFSEVSGAVTERWRWLDLPSLGGGARRSGGPLFVTILGVLVVAISVAAGRRRPERLGRRLRRALGERRGENLPLGLLLRRRSPHGPEATAAVETYERYRFGQDPRVKKRDVLSALRRLERAKPKR